mmetsp:Transcript_23875/g.39260  ORF Transcript_23875/g.39260 Transcript_23875/m.39260 type:complete len:283 (-) Transcript_23875:656-1504(-)|eukprot:CAMPEP_0184666314 /NCGR_PEP_ID=MMETSP0308-20130426/60928_1 /TAXON_ID=38269 /ORGANISM="Gloeochaete witrockiana, Strain SAG 46.84" /LENGTH=282 /DNA_ID=CAMNT_0027110817 /DNA_START=178 /DNA_END=1026 /DNA_ORIENTATION=+
MILYSFVSPAPFLFNFSRFDVQRRSSRYSCPFYRCKKYRSRYIHSELDRPVFRSERTDTPRDSRRPFVIGVAGGTASGKTSVCTRIIEQLGNRHVINISQDAFYRNLSSEELERVKEYNFDHPDAFDYELIHKTLLDLRSGRTVNIPLYDFNTNSRLEEYQSFSGVDVLLLEGILVFYTKELRDQMDMKIFVDTDADTRLARRVIRDIKYRGRDIDGVIRQYEKFVKPSFDDYIWPTKKYADIIIPRGAENTIAIDLIVQHIRLKLTELQEQSPPFNDEETV